MQYRTRISITLVVVTVGMMILRVAGFFGTIENLGRDITLPIARMFSTMGSGVRDIFFATPDARMLKERNKDLEARVSSLAVDYVRLRSLEEENRSLHTLIKFTGDSGYDNLAARVIARTTDGVQNSVMIDRGSQDGIEVGMALTVGEGIFVGKITGLQERTSIATLVTNEQSHVAASRAGQHALLGIVEGTGNGTTRLTLVSQTEALHINDIIVTSGTEDKIPPNLPIGFVNEVNGKATDPFKSAVLEPLMRADRLNIVNILRSAALRPSNTPHAK